jgi:hypothetical protein
MTFARRITEARERREAEKAANLAALCQPSRTLHKPTYSGGVSGEAVQKTDKAPSGQAEREHKDKLAALGCMVCLRLRGPHDPGPVELHHRRTGGWGKGDYLTLIPLCVGHHRGPSGVHGLGTKGFAKHYGFDQQDLLDDALRLVGASQLSEEA